MEVRVLLGLLAFGPILSIATGKEKAMKMLRSPKLFRIALAIGMLSLFVLSAGAPGAYGG